jgi:hypothetical protein
MQNQENMTFDSKLKKQDLKGNVDKKYIHAAYMHVLKPSYFNFTLHAHKLPGILGIPWVPRPPRSSS